MKIIQAKNISKKFSDVEVLRDLSFEVEKGTFTALLGKNGSGKSTILNILMGQTLINEGQCLLFNHDLRQNPDFLKNKIAHVSENISFNYPMDIDKFILEYAKFFSDFDTKLFFKMAKDVKLNLSKRFGEYSRGQRMQIVLMAALSQKAELIMIDEVTSVLDAFSRNYFINRMNEFTSQGGTIILTTNIVTEVQHYCTDIIFLADKKVKFQTKLDGIGSNFKKFRATTPHHKLLKNPNCFLSGTNPDGTFSYIYPAGEINLEEHSELIQDKRSVTLEELYIYHSQREENG